jgi:outer membrane receptor for ferrienterochelin and colicin
MTRFGKRRAAAPVLLALLGLTAPALAQQETPKDDAALKEKGDDKPIPTVQVKASNTDYDPRRDDTASKTVISQEELTKYGDTNVYDVLKRAPGVTVTGNTIRMRGLGAGYTQILVNGERAPPGFSLDDLPPDQIEKIEIVRAATAEFSMQAIAGTINIVLKKVVAKPQRDVRISSGGNHDGSNTFVSTTLADKTGSLSYFLNGGLSHNLNHPDGTGGDRFTAPDGMVTQLRSSSYRQDNTSTSLNLAPRVNWKLPNEDQLNVGGFIQRGRSSNTYSSAQVNSIGSFGAPDYVDRDSDNRSTFRFSGLDVNWIAKLAGGKLDGKLTVNGGSFDNVSLGTYGTAGRATVLLRDTASRSEYQTWTSTGKYTRSLFESNSLAVGWDISERKTDDHNLRIDRLTGAAPVTVDESFHPDVLRMAAYAQDEWNVTKLWSMYLGARWEGIRTESSGTGLDATDSRTHVLSPVAQTLYKFPGKSGRQVRLALTRTYKAPDVSQLSGRRYVAAYNTRFTPDSSGNPRLQPELATGVDATYEHFWAPGALFSVGGAVRHITGYIRNTLAEDANGLWLNSPRNDGDVQVRTLEMEVKLPLKLVWTAAPAIDLRASINRNWSKVDAVPGPDNRLDAQVPQSAVLGADYRRDKISAGGSLSVRAGGPLRISAQQSAQQYRRRDLDAYVLYKFTPKWQLRVALSNILGDDNRSLSRYQDDSGSSESWSLDHTAPRVQASLEIKL